MLKAEYTRNINKSSFIITPQKDCEDEKDSIEMFRYNDIPHFLKMETQRKDIKLQFRYDITSKRSLEQLLEYKSLDYEMLQMILHSFDQACTQTEDFMITEHDILLEPEFIFADHHMEHMYYCYLPGNHENICTQFKRFMEYLLQHLNHKDEQALQLAYGIYQKVVEERTALHEVLRNKDGEKNNNNRQLFDMQQENNRYCQNKNTAELEEVKQDTAEVKWTDMNYHITDLEQSEETSCQNQQLQQAANNVPQISSPQTEQIKNEKPSKKNLKKAEQTQENSFTRKTDEISKVKQKETLRKQAAEKLKNMLRKKIYTDARRYTEETTVFEADEEEITCSHPTVCLMPESNSIQNKFIFQGADRSRDFTCMHGKMLLGSDLSESDIYIPFPMVSRVHARIEINAQGTFLEDMNSTNGTHVNGELLQYHEKRMLQKGDIISLAGECYSFH